MPCWTQINPAPGITLYAAASNLGICSVSFTNNIPAAWECSETNPLLREVASQLTLYFHNSLKQFDVPLDLQGTPFQRKVWSALLEIPYGQVVSYADLAERIGSPKAFRAVGSANGRNPVPIIVPCHRVINAGGGLGGYSCGLAYKRLLLELEGVHLEKQLHLLAHSAL
jgi:methylated-DNA-[protein]-cysteine S-methyltransferase